MLMSIIGPRAAGWAFGAALIAASVNGPAASQELVCDADQLSKDCIACLVGQGDGDARDICYEQRSLPAPLDAGGVATCPTRISDFPPLVQRASASVREVMLANARLEATLAPFVDSGEDCEMLPDSIRNAPPAVETSEAPKNASGSAEAATDTPATRSVGVVQKLFSCIETTRHKLHDQMRRTPGSGRLSDLAKILGDQEIRLAEISKAMNGAKLQHELLNGRTQRYQMICQF